MGERLQLDTRFSVSDAWNKFKDMDPYPNAPDAVCGVSLDAAENFAKVLDDIRTTYMGGNTSIPVMLPEKVRAAYALHPLLQRAAGQEHLAPVDVRPYRRAIKEVSFGAGCGGTVTDLLMIIPPIGIATKIALNGQIEKEFIRQWPQTRQLIQNELQKRWSVACAIGSVENPREQYWADMVTMMNFVCETARQSKNRDQYRSLSDHAGEVLTRTLQAIGIGVSRVAHAAVSQDRSPLPLQLLPRLLNSLRPTIEIDGLLRDREYSMGMAAPEIFIGIHNALPMGEDRRIINGFVHELRADRHPDRENEMLHFMQDADISYGRKLNQLPTIVTGLVESIGHLLPHNGLKFKKAYKEEAALFGVSISD